MKGRKKDRNIKKDRKKGGIYFWSRGREDGIKGGSGGEKYREKGEDREKREKQRNRKGKESFWISIEKREIKRENKKERKREQDTWR